MIKFVFINNVNSIDDRETYTNKIMEEILSNSQFIKDLKKESAVKKISIESYLVQLTNENTYRVEYDFRTYEKISQLLIEISSVEENDKEKEVAFDEGLHQLKIALKNKMIKNWEKCIWLYDRQSIYLSQKLYYHIHNVENLTRQLINDTLIKYYGINWWEVFAPYKMKLKYQKRLVDFKRTVFDYKNIDECLLSIDTNDLFNLINLKYEKWEPKYDTEIENLILNSGLDQNLNQKLKEKLKTQLICKIDFWDSIFSRYLDDEFQLEMENFCKNRNHIAHNKLLDYESYNKIKNNAEKLEKILIEAIDKVSEDMLSIEEKEQNYLLLQEEKLEKDVLNEIIESESGVEIRDEEEIFKLYCHKIEQLYEWIRDAFYFRSDIELTNLNNIKNIYSSQYIFSIYSKLYDEELKVQVSFLINAGEGETSEAIFEVFKASQVEVCKEVKYINGEAVWNSEQGYYMPEIEDEFDDNSLKEFVDILEEYVESVFPSLRKEIDLMKYRVLKNGGELPVGAFECSECGEPYVCIDENYKNLGVCINCGYKNEIVKCIRCGEYYNADYEKNKELCDSCLEYIRKQ